MQNQTEQVLEKMRDMCLSLPGTTERLSHGEPTWFVQEKRSFVMFSDHHHGGRLSFWCAAFPGIQALLTGSEPEQYFRPPYVGHRGWLGVYLDVPVDWDTIGKLVRDAYRVVAPKRFASQLPPD